MIDREGTVWVAGASGLVGRAVVDAFKRAGHPVLDTRVDLTDESEVSYFFGKCNPRYVILCAAKVGGIVANRDNPVDFIDTNMRIELNVMKYAKHFDVKKLLFLGSACAYPKHAPVPIKEEYLLQGILEPTNKGYALSKILGIELCKAYRKQYGCNFISAMPTNIYGPGDHYDLENSHVLPGMMHRIHAAKLANEPYVTLWGDGTPRREFLFSEDLARAIVYLMYQYDGEETVNLGSGYNIALGTLAELLVNRIQYPGFVKWDTDKPNGTPNRLLDCSKIFDLGWTPKVSLEAGIAITYNDFLKRWPNVH